MSKSDAHKQALRQLFDRFGIQYIDGSSRRRELLIEEIIRVSERFNHNPSLDEALNSGNGTYKP